MSNEKLYNDYHSGFVYVDKVVGIIVGHEALGSYIRVKAVALLTDGGEFELQIDSIVGHSQELLEKWTKRLDEARSKSIQIPTLAKLGIDMEKEWEEMKAVLDAEHKIQDAIRQCTQKVLEVKFETTGVPDEEA